MNLPKLEYKMLYECELYFQGRLQPLSDVQNEKEKEMLRKAFNLIFVSVWSQEYTIYKRIYI